MDEYLEKVVEAAFKREFEQDENIVRSLPFFVTALGLAIAIFTQIAPRVNSLSLFGGVVLWLVLALAGSLFVTILWCLFQIVRGREFKIPPNEQSYVAWARDLEQFYRVPGRSAAKATELACKEARRVMIDAYAEAAVDNRTSNKRKFGYRAQGFTFLVILIALASLSVGVIFVDRQWSSLSANGAERGEETRITEDRAERINGSVLRSGETEAETSPGEDRSARGEVPLGSRGERLADDRKNSSTAATPASSSAADGIREEERGSGNRTSLTSTTDGSIPVR